MKKLLSILLIMIMCVSVFTGCGAKQDDVVKIGVSISNFDDTFLMYMKDGMDKYAKELGAKVEVTYVDAKEDAAKQLSQVENFISQGMDSIVVVPVDTQATEPITSTCVNEKVNLVYVNRLPANLPAEVTFVGSNSKDAGVFQMEYLAEKLGKKGNVVVMLGKLDNEATQKRTEGVKEIVSKNADMAVIKEQTAEWSRAKAMTLMENWLSSGDKIDVVACNNDDMALGALKAIEAAGKLGEILVGGVDATPDALKEVESGKLSCTVFQDANGQGLGAIKAAVDMAEGTKVEHEIWIPFQLVTPDNYKDFMK